MQPPRRRTSGILLHPTSLPGGTGVGDLGEDAFRFVDFLRETGQGLWQVLPLGPTGYGDSPYQSFSAFAGNPLLVSLEGLAREGLLTRSDLRKAPRFPRDEVDFGGVIDFKLPALSRAHQRFLASATAEQRDDFAAFCARHEWLEDYATFSALKDAFSGRPWTEWDADLSARRPEALARFRAQHAQVLEDRRFRQYLFFRQWEALRARCRAHGIRLMGDIPIFVAHDSADVWAQPHLFRLRADGKPACVAGVPPDYFSQTGQLWGNPLYRWEATARTGYAWWIARFRATLELVDLVRLDHFRGFEAYWEVPAEETTAVRGRWVPGPGQAFFDALAAALGGLPIVAEDLGVITPEVVALRDDNGLPGMAILQFAFGTDPSGPGFLPHNYRPNLFAYTGTHDNDTIVGWWTGGVGESTRSEGDVETERDFCRRYLGTDGTDIHWVLIRAVLASVADTAVVPLQDVLGVGSEGRMNVPARASGNWRWRFTWEQLTAEVRDRLAEMTRIYGRAV